MARPVVRQIERGETTLATTATTATITLATTLADTAKAIIIITGRSGSANSLDYQVTADIISTTQIKFDRAATPGIDMVIEWQVVEYTQGVSVQRFNVTQSGTLINTTITAIDTAKAFPIVTARQTGTTLGSDDFVIAEMTTTTNLQTRSVAGSASYIVNVQVVQFEDATVQKFVTTYGTGATMDLTVSAIDPAKTFWFFSIDSSASTFGNHMPYLDYINSTTLRFTRQNAAGINFNVVAYVVSIPNGITVQNITTTIASSGTTVSPSIAPVRPEFTTYHACGVYQRWASVNAADDDAGGFSFGIDTLTSTSFTATRTDAPALAATTIVQLIEWASRDNSAILGTTKRYKTMAMLAR